MKKLQLLFITVFFTLSVHAEWKLDNEDSHVNFISIKKSSIAEIHGFKSLSGSINGKEATVKIDLSSVETNIPIRNERMRNILFNVDRYPTALITAKIDGFTLDELRAGRKIEKQLEIKLELHGMTKSLSAKVNIVKLLNNQVLVHSIYPIIVKASDYGLEEGIKKLKSIAKLPSISTAVPVTFSLVFTK